MPSPVGHALGGALVGVLCAPRSLAAVGSVAARVRAALGPTVVVAAAVAACVPDLDFLWGRHNMESHSLGAALLAGGLAGVWRRDRRLGVAVALAWATHVGFDWLGSDDTPPLGVMALWPVTSTFYFADAYVFDAISRRYWLDNFWWHNLRAVLSEIVMVLPVLAAVVWWRARGGVSDPA